MTIAIRPAQREEDFDAFFAYLDEHLADNGRAGTPLFQPLAPGATFPVERQGSFRDGAVIPVGQAQWRRLWLAWDGERIAGHIDLRARLEPACAHRCLLGMGVHGAYRRHGLGTRLIETAASWASAQGLAYIDLEVLTVNEPAQRLYERTGFIRTGAIRDFFRIAGASLGYTFMTRTLRP
ncbi:MAG: N-acetyltransferase family protein [Telluria sp.]